VVKQLSQIGQVNPGEILIVNSTDPGWTPVNGDTGEVRIHHDDADSDAPADSPAQLSGVGD
jgi:hypothetical protein